MTKILLAIFTMCFCGQAFGIFSSHAVVTPENVAEHEDFRVWLYSRKEDPDMVNVILPFHEGMKKYWLVTSTRELEGEELELRNLLWSSYEATPDYIRRIVPIAPTLDENGHTQKGSFIRLKIRKDALATSYIYQDFDEPVDDGGWYRTFVLSSFPVGAGIDPLMEVEWDISQSERRGENTKHRDAEKKLRQMVADKVFMEDFGQRYDAEQDIAKKAAAREAAKKKLEEAVGMDEAKGSVYAQAKLDGIDYRPILRKAIALDKESVESLFAMSFMGEGGESHAANLLHLMQLSGDDWFSEILSGQDGEIRGLVVGSIKHAWADPEWDLFPKTLQISPGSIAGETNSEDVEEAVENREVEEAGSLD